MFKFVISLNYDFKTQNLKNVQLQQREKSTRKEVWTDDFLKESIRNCIQ